MRLRDKVAIVTGAGRGIGRAIAVSFIAEGAFVVAVERDHTSLASLQQEFPASALLAIEGDASTQAVVDDTVRRALAVGNRLDILVNNAISYTEHGVTSTTDADWAATIDSGLTSIFRWCRAALPPMLDAGRGSIVNLASVNQLVANPNLAAYTAAKGGVHALTKQIAVEYGPRGIRCNAVSPALIVTERTMVGRNVADLAWDAEAYPVGRVGYPVDVAAAVVFLASDEAGFISGIDLPVDGGLTALAASALISPKVRRWWGRKPLTVAT
jgi:NAD(P)-dependent dehydrogenase (short-subunit alcohol dehydrogenase family)